MKPTAQELWERIEEEMQFLYDGEGWGNSQEDHWCIEFFQDIKHYAKTYHEEQMRDFVGIPQGEFTCAFLDRINAGLIKLKTYPYNPQNND